ncbi:MAG: hypothetical protein KGQ89_06520, partial [Verrucomicrobia bacterium]|nr:hypothetical protein [Verrucomicrobiota bacterium]
SEISENQLPNQVLARPESPHIDFERNFKSDRLLGVDYVKARAFTFDDELAKDSLCFIPIEAIPRIPDELPEGISELRYTVLIPPSARLQSHHPGN